MKIKKLGALLVSAALCAGMAAPAFAFEGEAAPVEQPVLPEVVEEDVVTITDETSGALTPEGNLTLVDDAHIYVGDCVMFGPNVTVATAGHPIEPGLRRQAMQYNADVRIGSNVWVGAGAVILPGVTIGDDTVIGAGSVVTKDIPAGVVAVGCPCRVLRPIGPQDRETYFRGRKIDVPLE